MMKNIHLSYFVAFCCRCSASSISAEEAFPDKLLTTPTTPEVVAEGLETDGYQLGISAYVWGYPLVRMERIARQYTNVPDPKPPTSYRAPLNKIGWAAQTEPRKPRTCQPRSNHTFYMSAVVKLDQSLPIVSSRYS